MSLTQTQCQSRYSGRISYDFMKSVTGFDEWVAWRDGSCDNVAHTKSSAGRAPPARLTLKIYRVTS